MSDFILRRAVPMLALLQIACVASDEALDDSLSKRNPPTAEASAPAIPDDFRSLTLAPVEKALEPLKRLAASKDTEARHELATIYKHAGFMGAARFFENTIREAEGGAIDIEVINAKVAWSASEREMEVASLDISQRAAALQAQARYDEAVAVLQREITSNGITLQLATQWSRAVLWQTIFSPEIVAPEAVEVALRITLTSLEEKIPRAIGLSSRAAGYDDLAKFFLSRGDSLSCKTAARTALLLFRRDQSNSSGADEAKLKDLLARECIPNTSE